MPARISILLLLLCAFQLDAYDVVLKSGEFYQGELVRETEDAIVLRSYGVEKEYKKALVDMETTKALNEAAEARKAILNNLPKNQTSLAELASRTKASQTGNAKSYTEGDVPCSPGSTFDPEGRAPELREDIAELQLELDKWEYSERIINRQGKVLSRENLAHMEELRRRIQWKYEEIQEGKPALERHQKLDDAASATNQLRHARAALNSAADKGDVEEMN